MGENQNVWPTASLKLGCPWEKMSQIKIVDHWLKVNNTTWHLWAEFYEKYTIDICRQMLASAKDEDDEEQKGLVLGHWKKETNKK